MEFSKSNKPLTIFSLTMMNVIAVDSLRNLTVSAEYGTALIFFYVVAAIMFYIPSVLIGAELATGWPQTGGAYIWIREAFGRKVGFLAMWLQWGYNVAWFPTILAFIAGTVGYLVSPDLAVNKHYLLATVLVLYWAVTLVNCFGVKVSARLSVIGAVVGTLLPMLFIIILGAAWFFGERQLQINFSFSSFWPDAEGFSNLGFLVGLIFSLMGMEMSAVHAGEVDKPEKNYPKALLYSSILIWFSLVLSSLAIALVIPKQQLNLVSGLVDAFNLFLSAYGLSILLPLVILAIVIGCLASVSAWVIGPTRGLLIAAKESDVMRSLHRTNKREAPVAILVFQAIVFTALSSVFLLMPTINSSYWILTALTSQLALLYYALLFASALRLRYTAPMVKRAYEIPGGKLGMWIVVVFGIISCIAAILLGFLPPAQLHIQNVFSYEAFLIGGFIVFCGVPFLITRRT